MSDWQPDTAWESGTTAGANDNWTSGPANDDGGDGFGDGNISKHDRGNSGGCFNCGEEGHNKSECPQPRQNFGECYNCGETGHNKADCPNPRVERAFTGTCRHCNVEGHRAAECPEKPPQKCRACGNDGHNAAECTQARIVYGDDVKVVDADDAWAILVDADKVKDIDGFKKALMAYTRASPEVTFVQVEQSLRESEMNTHLIGKEQEISDTHTIVNLQGKNDCKYVVSYQLTSKPVRAKFAQGWPSSPEENLKRLEDAGIVMDRMVPKCGNCGELGHSSKRCTQEPVEREKVEISCPNCKEQGHRLRDCPNPRQDRNACRNCKQPGHKATDCPEPRSAEGVECRACGETGHFASDCPTKGPDTCRRCGEEGHRAADCSKERVFTCHNCNQEGHQARECTEPRNPATMKCRNCDEMGHMSRDCPLPRDYSRVQCTNCSEFGHTKTRCKAAPKEEEDGESGGVPTGGWGDGGDTAGVDASGGEKAWGAAEASAGGW